MVLRRHAWISSYGFSSNVHASLMDMPFDGTLILGDEAGSTLERF